MRAWLEGPQERLGGRRLETVLWRAFKFGFRWKVGNGAVSVGVSLEKVDLLLVSVF